VDGKYSSELLCIKGETDFLSADCDTATGACTVRPDGFGTVETMRKCKTTCLVAPPPPVTKTWNLVGNACKQVSTGAQYKTQAECVNANKDKLYANCNTTTGQCEVVAGGSDAVNTYAHCTTHCKALPPGPVAKQWKFDSSKHACVKVNSGGDYESSLECQKANHDDVSANCVGDGQCTLAADGSGQFLTYTECMSKCTGNITANCDWTKSPAACTMNMSGKGEFTFVECSDKCTNRRSLYWGLIGTAIAIVVIIIVIVPVVVVTNKRKAAGYGR
jgi:hypothetical protein